MSDSLPQDPYKALGLHKDTSTDAVRKAFRKLALTCHPDKTKGLADDERKQKDEQFHSIKNAHDLLVDDEERRRYDLKVERDHLLRRPTYGPSRSQNSAPSRPQPSKASTQPIFKTREPHYEYREPRKDREPKTNTYEYDSRPRFETRRPVAKEYDDHFEPLSPGGSRRSSGRANGDRRERGGRDEDDRYYKKREEQELKEQERRMREDVKRRMDTARRQDAQYKHSRDARVESDSSTDSDINDFMRSSRARSPESKPKYDSRKYESRKGSRRQDDERRKRSSEESDSEDEVVRRAKQHMQTISGKIFPDDSPKRSAYVKSKSSSKKAPPAPQPPPPAPVEKRSSGRRGSSQVKSSSKMKPEIVEPSSDYDRYSDERREMKKSNSKSTQNTRASTFREKTPEKPSGNLRRSHTAPVDKPSSAGNTPAKASYSRRATVAPIEESESESSDSSDGERRYPQKPKQTTTTTSYRVYDSDERRPGSARVQLVEVSPARETAPSRRREPSPRASKQYVEHERPSSSSHRRDQSSRVKDFVPPPPKRSATHAASGSGDRRLFGEITPEFKVNYSQPITADSIQYGSYVPAGRRGSVEDGLLSHDPKIMEALSHMRNTNHPGMGARQNSHYRQELNGTA